MASLFESYERRIDKINAVLAQYGINGVEDAKAICAEKGLDPYKTCEETQPICFENAKWAYVVGAAIAIKKGCKNAADAAEAIGEGLQAFCIPGSVADDRKVGIGHGNLAARLLREETQCFAFLAGHESFAAAEGAIKIAEMANKVRKNPLRVILNGLGKDAAQIISRINGFTYVQTKFDYYTGELAIVKETPYSTGLRGKVRCYGADDVREGVAVMWKEDVDVSITGNSTNPTRFQHPVAGTYKKERVLAGKKYFSVASGGGTGRTLHPDNMAAGPASYGMTDTMGRDALGRPVRRFVVGSRTRGDDGLPRHGQQPDGRRYGGRRGGCRAGDEIVLPPQDRKKGAYLRGYAPFLRNIPIRRAARHPQPLSAARPMVRRKAGRSRHPSADTAPAVHPRLRPMLRQHSAAAGKPPRQPRHPSRRPPSTKNRGDFRMEISSVSQSYIAALLSGGSQILDVGFESDEQVVVLAKTRTAGDQVTADHVLLQSSPADRPCPGWPPR